MKPIIGLAVIAVASAALGTGFLNNDIELWIQQFGVGAGDVTSPTDHALIDFHIDQVTGTDGFFKNIIDLCIVTLDDNVGIEDDASLPDGSNAQNHVTCKLTGKDADGEPNGLIIAEGTVWADFYLADTPINVPVTDTNGNSLIPVGDVGDVILVVQAETHADSDGNLMP